jgi:hypothetical protein
VKALKRSLSLSSQDSAQPILFNSTAKFVCLKSNKLRSILGEKCYGINRIGRQAADHSDNLVAVFLGLLVFVVDCWSSYKNAHILCSSENISFNVPWSQGCIIYLTSTDHSHVIVTRINLNEIVKHFWKNMDFTELCQFCTVYHNVGFTNFLRSDQNIAKFQIHFLPCEA